MIFEKIKIFDGFMKAGIYTFVNPYSYLKIRNYARVDKIDSIMVDGIVAVIIFKLLGFKCKRQSFDMTSLAPMVFKWASEENKKIALIGAQIGVAEKAAQFFIGQYPAANFTYIRDGYFKNDAEFSECARYLSAHVKPDIVIVGMGAPLQEEFLVELKSLGWQGLGFTCGGFLHQTACKGIKYYPDTINKLNLRWVYRMYDEPKLIKRYVFDYPKFFFFVVYDLLKKK
ncbi:WecB/TagA/CpsF family glycosyltransferase [Marinobacterium sp. D7]|nr:WecB/TagA/CpsF family glycosyltransferase [Marinobacterium ramblicola]